MKIEAFADRVSRRMGRMSALSFGAKIDAMKAATEAVLKTSGFTFAKDVTAREGRLVDSVAFVVRAAIRDGAIVPSGSHKTTIECKYQASGRKAGGSTIFRAGIAALMLRADYALILSGNEKRMTPACMPLGVDTVERFQDTVVRRIEALKTRRRTSKASGAKKTKSV